MALENSTTGGSEMEAKMEQLNSNSDLGMSIWMKIVPYLAIGVALIAAILLQILLSKSKKKWPGVCLPILFGAISLSLGIYQQLTSPTSDAMSIWTYLLVTNIPTVALLVIYMINRQKIELNHK